MQTVRFRRIGFDKFNILSINECIGCYEKDKSLNFIDDKGKKKIFKMYKIEIVIAPKNRKKFIIPKADYDIGYALKKLDNKINYKPFVKDGEIYYSIEDTSNYVVKDIYVYLDSFYTWKDGYKIISDMLKRQDNDIKIYVNYNNAFYDSLRRTRKIDYLSDITIYDKD